MRRIQLGIVLLALVGCGGGGDVMGVDGGPRPDSGTPQTDGGPVGQDGGPGTDGGLPVTTVEVTDNITAATTWTADHVYHLNQLTFVTGNVVLTIEPGTTVTGAEGSALIVTRGSQLQAVGTAERPIVFTSENTGSTVPPAAGDWGGVVLLGTSELNLDLSTTAGVGHTHIEGIDPTLYGNMTTFGADPDHGVPADENNNCGHIAYARIEYAGYVFSPNNELNGLTIGACGSGTLIEYLEVLRGKDDGVELFGGSANLRHVMVVAPGDDYIDWDFGYHGTVQFYLGVSIPGTDGEDNSIEADNNRDNNEATPRSAPEMWNSTFIGPGHGTTRADEWGALLRRGTSAHIHNTIFMETIKACINVADVSTNNQFASSSPIDHSVLFDCGPDGQTFFEPQSTDSTGAMIGTSAAVVTTAMAEANANQFGVDPGIEFPVNNANPNFTPNSALATGGATPPAGSGPAAFDTTATYIGAVAPGSSTPWYSGWTRIE